MGDVRTLRYIGPLDGVELPEYSETAVIYPGDTFEISDATLADRILLSSDFEEVIAEAPTPEPVKRTRKAAGKAGKDNQ